MQSSLPFVRALELPRKYMKPGILSLEVTEFSLRSRKMPNGYWVTLAAIVIPSKDRTVFGASACSPDEAVFSRKDAANRALGRARQTAFRVWDGIVVPGMDPEIEEATLLGKERNAVFMTPESYDLQKIQALAEPLFTGVAARAAYQGALHSQRFRNRFDPNFNWSFVLKK